MKTFEEKMQELANLVNKHSHFNLKPEEINMGRRSYNKDKQIATYSFTASQYDGTLKYEFWIDNMQDKNIMMHINIVAPKVATAELGKQDHYQRLYGKAYKNGVEMPELSFDVILNQDEELEDYN